MRSFVSLTARLRGTIVPILVLSLSLVVARGAVAMDDAAAEPSLATAPVGVPVAISGTLLGTLDGGLAVQETGSTDAVAFPVVDAERLTVTRGGDEANLGLLQAGDSVSMTIDGLTGRVLRVDAQAAAGSRFAPSNEVGLLAALGLVAAAALLTARLRRPQPLAAAAARRPLADAVATRAAVAGQGAIARVLETPRAARASVRG